MSNELLILVAGAFLGGGFQVLIEWVRHFAGSRKATRDTRREAYAKFLSTVFEAVEAWHDAEVEAEVADAAPGVDAAVGEAKAAAILRRVAGHVNRLLTQVGVVQLVAPDDTADAARGLFRVAANSEDSQEPKLLGEKLGGFLVLAQRDLGV